MRDVFALPDCVTLVRSHLVTVTNLRASHARWGESCDWTCILKVPLRLVHHLFTYATKPSRWFRGPVMKLTPQNSVMLFVVLYYQFLDNNVAGAIRNVQYPKSRIPLFSECPFDNIIGTALTLVWSGVLSHV